MGLGVLCCLRSGKRSFVMRENVWRGLGFTALIVLATALWLPREPEVLFAGSVTLLGLLLVLTQLEDK